MCGKIRPHMASIAIVSAILLASSSAPQLTAQGVRALAQEAFDNLCSNAPVPHPPCGTFVIVPDPTVSNGRAVADFDPSQARTAIMYSPPFIVAVYSAHGEDAVFGVIAHEIGHHFQGVFPGIRATPNSELQSDIYAGCAVAYSGRSLDDVLAFVEAFGGAPPLDAASRAVAVKFGYQSCGGASATR